jgi:hypothetical protein
VPKGIVLTQGYVALVDDEDYEKLNKYNWTVVFSHGTLHAYRKEHHLRTILMHRQIMGVLNAGRLVQVDHINNDGLDNRRANLRIVTSKQNSENRNGAQSNSTTGIRGVSLDKRWGKYVAQIHQGGKHIYLGAFWTLEEAEQAAIAGRRKHFTHSGD